MTEPMFPYTPDYEVCPNGCGCVISAEGSDADAHECGCDGRCTMGVVAFEAATCPACSMAVPAKERHFCPVIDEAPISVLYRALAAIDTVRLTPTQLENPQWADGFRQGWQAARDAIERLR